MICIIATFKRTKEIIEKYGVIFRKNYGQNFLIDTHVLNKIIASSEITKDDVVIEVGPGIGSLTEALAMSAKKVIAVEIDKELIPVLNDTLKQYDNITIINEDILKLDLTTLIDGESNVKLVANLPYYITTPIIMNILENNLPISMITVMVQKEVGERMRAVPGKKDYGALSLVVKYYADCYLVANVPQNCFMPRPNVDSVVIRLDVLKQPPVSVLNEQALFTFIKAGFFQRRKTLLNCLINYPGLELGREAAKGLLNECGFPEDVRGEKLTLSDYAALSNAAVKLALI